MSNSDTTFYPPFVSKPIRDLMELKESGEPITLTINGKISLPIRDIASFDKLVDFVDWLHNVEEIRLALEDCDRGKMLTPDEAMARLKGRHDVPR